MIKRSRTTKRRQDHTPSYRINRHIRVREVMLVDHENLNRGVVSTNEARDIAYEAGLDLVEVAPNARPPVCRIMDFSKFSYEQKKKYREARKKQKVVEIKTIKLKIKTGTFHRDIQVKKARMWLEEGKKVKVSIRFYGRERDYPELAQGTMKGISSELSDVSTIEQRPMMEGWSMTMMLAPTNEAPDPKESATTPAKEEKKARAPEKAAVIEPLQTIEDSADSEETSDVDESPDVAETPDEETTPDVEEAPVAENAPASEKESA